VARVLAGGLVPSIDRGLDIHAQILARRGLDVHCVPELAVLPLERLSNVLSLDKLGLERPQILFQVNGLLDQVLALIFELLKLYEQVCSLFTALIRVLLLHAQLVELLLQVLVLGEETVSVSIDTLSVSERRILPQELFDARNQFQLLLCRQILIFIKQQLEFVLQAPDKLIERDLILVIG